MAVRGSCDDDQIAELKGLKSDWVAAGGSNVGTAFFDFTKAALELVQASASRAPMIRAVQENLVRAKQQWRALARGE